MHDDDLFSDFSPDIQAMMAEEESNTITTFDKATFKSLPEFGEWGAWIESDDMPKEGDRAIIKKRDGRFQEEYVSKVVSSMGKNHIVRLKHPHAYDPNAVKKQ